MRIISGFLKGKSINFVKNYTTRPLKDSVKENIFNILIHSNYFKVKIQKSRILDLYSGIGSFGIECISRGAEKVTFVEKDKNTISILKKNLNKHSILNNADVFHQNIEDFLKRNVKGKFHIFFFDPPFADKNFVKNLKAIKDSKFFEDEHIVIIHREKKSKENLENIINIIKTKNYSRSKIIFGFFS